MSTTPAMGRVISKETLLPVGFVLLLLTGALWLNNQLVGLNHSLDLIDIKLEGIEADLQRGVNDRWRGMDMKVWTLLLEARNPALDIPDPLLSRHSGLQEESR